tara:strand:+ start:2270 stop:2506 length:237 start_codon:yes stop_codon:yes gene_type:complete
VPPVIPIDIASVSLFLSVSLKSLLPQNGDFFFLFLFFIFFSFWLFFVSVLSLIRQEFQKVPDYFFHDGKFIFHNPIIL